KISTIQERVTGRVHLRYVDIRSSAVDGLIGKNGGKVRRACSSCDAGVAGRIYRDAAAKTQSASAEVRGVEQVSRRAQFGYEGAGITSGCRLKRIPYREVARIGHSGHISVACGIHG